MTIPTTQDPTGTTTAPVTHTAPPAPVTAPPPPAPTQALYAQEDVYAPDGKKWRDKFHGREGYVKQKEAGWLSDKGSLTARLETLQQAIGERDATIASLTGQIGSLTETSGTIPALREEIATLKLEAAKAGKYQVAMRYPALLSLRAEEEVPLPEGQEGEPTKVTTNPVLDLIESSGLDSVQLELTLRRMVTAMSVPSIQPPAGPAAVLPAVPSPVEPVAGGDKEAWIARAKEAQARVNAGEIGAWDDFEAAAQKIRELEVAEASSK